MIEKDKIRDEIIDRVFGMFYGIGQLMPLSSLWDKKFELPMQCLRFCLRNTGMMIQALENGKQNETDFNSINRYVSVFSFPTEFSYKQLAEARFAYAFFILLLCRLSSCDVKSFFDWSSLIDTIIHEASICGLYDEEIIQWFIDKTTKDNYSLDIIRKWENRPPLTSLAGAISLINTSWSWKYNRFGIRYIIDPLGVNDCGTHRPLEPSLFPIILGSIAGGLIGRHTLAMCYDGCEMIGRQELQIAVEIGNMIATPGIVPETNEGFFTNILIVSDDPDDETADMAAYLELKYPNATIYTLICQEGQIALLEELYNKITANSIDMVIGMRSVASTVCQMRETAKILIFPQFHNIWAPDDVALQEESIFGGMTFKQKGLAYGVFARRHISNDDIDARLYWKYYKCGVRGYESGTVSSYLIDNLNSIIWNQCTPTVLPEYKPSTF